MPQVVREVASLSNRYGCSAIFGSTGRGKFADEPKAKGASYEFRAYPGSHSWDPPGGRASPTPSLSRTGTRKGA